VVLKNSGKTRFPFAGRCLAQEVFLWDNQETYTGGKKKKAGVVWRLSRPFLNKN
jgi:hypothetical protein